MDCCRLGTVQSISEAPTLPLQMLLRDQLPRANQTGLDWARTHDDHGKATTAPQPTAIQTF